MPIISEEKQNIFISSGIQMRRATKPKRPYAITAGSVLTLTGFMVLTCTHLNKIGLILNGVVTEKIPFAFYACAVFALHSSVACIVACFMGTDKETE